MVLTFESLYIVQDIWLPLLRVWYMFSKKKGICTEPPVPEETNAALS